MLKSKLILAAALAALPVFSAETTTGSVRSFEDVETLMDGALKLDGQKVAVAGEVERKHGARAFILESGGLVNDEVVVLVPKKVADAQVNLIRDDADLRITGVIRNVPIADVERELGWNLEPQVRTKLERVKTYLVAENIAPHAD